MTDKRDRLEAAALDAVQRNGLKGLSFRTLADEIGIKSSSVHYYFPEKSDLARTLIERYSQEFSSQLEAIDKQRWGLRRKIKAFIEIFETVARNEKLCLCGMMAAELEQLDDNNRRLLSEYFLDTERWLISLFEQHRDELQSQIASQVLARGLLSALEGGLLLDRAVGDDKRIKALKELFLLQLR